MAKRPVAGAVKSRLARGIGSAAALRFYRTTLTHTLLRLGRDPRWRTYLAVAPDVSVAESCWPSTPMVTRVPQGHGDLGARMQSLVDRMPPGPVIIVGSDIPAVRPRHIAKAFHELGRADAVFGPAQDGGYWLVGLRRRPRRLVPFENVPWSTGQALSATLANLRGRFLAFSSTLSDVDTAQDYKRERACAARLFDNRLIHVRATGARLKQL
jgi:uncharacterized protein